MYHARTVFGRYKVTANHPKSIALQCFGRYIWHQLLKTNPHQRTSCNIRHINIERHLLIAHLVVRKSEGIVFFRKISTDPRCGQNNAHFRARIRVKSFHLRVSDIRPNRQCHVAWQRPRCCRPSHDAHIFLVRIEQKS